LKLKDPASIEAPQANFHHQGSLLEGIERIKREKEEIKGNEAEALPNRNCDQFVRHSSFGVLRMTIG